MDRDTARDRAASPDRGASPLAPPLRKLFLESRAVEIIAEALSAITQVSSGNSSSRLLTRQDGLRLARAKEFIALNLTAPLNVPTIARAAGINVSGLQRLFQLCDGMSVFEYIRKVRLESAYEALVSGEISISSASILAGYSSPENFTTAFRRQFQITPRQLLKKN
ncbi:helix-turn-helix transcriptional regulator [Ochrobactrum cytisi]|nr:helix-turn-helix transcriptional regulator [Brucella cytisi]